MSGPHGDLDAAAVQSALATTRFGRSLDLRARTGSTNDDAREAIAAGAADGHVIVADSQSSGRGSRGRTWISPAGTDLYLSVVARVPVALSQLPPLTLAIGLAVADVVDGVCGAGRARVKWPNDVWVGREKVAGILVEGASLGSDAAPLVVGVGLNVNRKNWPDGLDNAPTSLCRAAGHDCDRSQVLASLLNALERWVDRFVADGPTPVVQALNTRLALRGERVTCDGVEGELLGVAPGGALQIRSASGVQDVVAGTLRPL